jgi:uncharacterized DUF497 family protein
MFTIYNWAVKTDGLADLEGFDWDKGNADKNRLKHDVTDGECEEVFFNSPLLLADDPTHSAIERRFAAFGVTNAGRRLTVVFTIRKRLIRIISARDMNRKEREFYEEDPKI